MRIKRTAIIVLVLAVTAVMTMASCTSSRTSSTGTDNSAKIAMAKNKDYNKADIEKKLDLSNNKNQKWTYEKKSDAWVMGIVSAVAYPEIKDEEGVSVCVPAAYIKGIDTDGDGKADVTAASYSSTVKGSLVIDTSGSVTSTNGQKYTAETAPLILNTGAQGYSEQTNMKADTTYAKEGYINIACGNRGKQSTIKDSDGNKS